MKPTMRLNAGATYLLLEGGRSFLFTIIFAASALYQVRTIGLSPLQLVLVGTVLEGVYFLFQIPTGVLADVYSRKWSVIIGVVLTGIGFVVEGITPTFAGVLVAMVLWGIGATFVDGALEAWITDEVGQDAAAGLFLREGQIGGVVNIAGVVIGVVLGSAFALATPIWLGGALLIALGLLMIVVMRETGFQRNHEDRRHPFRQMSDTLVGGIRVIRGKPLLILLTLVSLVNGLYSEGYDRLGTAHLVRTIGFPTVFGIAFQEVQWMGFISIVGSLIGIGITEIVRRKLDPKNEEQTAHWLMAGTLVMAGCIFAFAWANGIALALTALWLGRALRGVLHTILFNWSNRQISGEDGAMRATVLSMWSQADALGQIVGGPAVGAIGNASLRLALSASGALVTLKLPLYARALQISKASADVALATPATTLGEVRP